MTFRTVATFAWTLAWLPSSAASAALLAEPPVFESKNHVLDIMIVAKAAEVPTLTPFQSVGWIYEICARPKNNALSCPPSVKSVNWYGGSRLKLTQGDTLKIRLVNKLPPIFGPKHANDPGFGYLVLNPTNLHTHGMLVDAHYPTLTNKTYGDNVFVLTLNPANGKPDSKSHIHGDVRLNFTDYEIKIPKNHPSGLFWFHPHAHGIALNQISAGMAGIITIGDVRDYLCRGGSCPRFVQDIPTRHLILKDTQILPGRTILDQQEPQFCHHDPDVGDPPRQGWCPGQLVGDFTYLNGRWIFTVNGLQYPTVPINSPLGEIWRITNASASVSYDLQLFNPAQKRNMIVQIVAIDGVSISAQPATSNQQFKEIGATKLDPVPCPPGTAGHGGLVGQPLCVRRLIMMPSSRVEFWVTYRDVHDNPAPPPSGATAILRTTGFETGPVGDAWPSIDLARVEFHAGAFARGGGVPAALNVEGQGRELANPVKLASDLAQTNKAFRPEADCKPLRPGHKRRIFFNILLTLPPKPGSGKPPIETIEPSAFGMGYEELDEKGNPVPGTFQDIVPFDAGTPTVCLTLAPGNKPVKEQWELINISGEDHNFHMHQSKFRLVAKDELDGTITPLEAAKRGLLHDNVPVRHADGTCDNVADFRKGKCVVHPVHVEIPFTIAGDYVYHCHILEHEDGGMMARIRVRAAP